MKKMFLPILAAFALQSCDPSVFPGDDPGNRCTINNVKWSCSRTDATTLYIKALLLNNNFDCHWDEEIPVWVTVYNNQWGIVWYKLRSSNNPDNPDNPNNTPLEDERPNQTVLLKPDQSLSWWIETKNIGQQVTIEYRTIDPITAKKQIIGVYSSDCEYIPPCELIVSKTCFKIDPSNHCKWTAEYWFTQCVNPTTFHGVFSLKNGMQFARTSTLPNAPFAPVMIIIKNSNWTVARSYPGTPIFEAWWVIVRFNETLNQWQTLHITTWTQAAIKGGQTVLTLTPENSNINSTTITQWNDVTDCPN